MRISGSRLRCGSASGRLTCNPRPAGICPKWPGRRLAFDQGMDTSCRGAGYSRVALVGQFLLRRAVDRQSCSLPPSADVFAATSFPESGGRGSSGRGRCGLLNSMWRLGRLFPRSGRLAQFSRGGGVCAGRGPVCNACEDKGRQPGPPNDSASRYRGKALYAAANRAQPTGRSAAWHPTCPYPGNVMPRPD